jgi:hypothetical protein
MQLSWRGSRKFENGGIERAGSTPSNELELSLHPASSRIGAYGRFDVGLLNYG